jgi:hypothetical protein
MIAMSRRPRSPCSVIGWPACWFGFSGRTVSVYFVGSDATGGYLPGASDVAALWGSMLIQGQKRRVAAIIVEGSGTCPASGVEFTLYRRDVVRSAPRGADVEVNANGGPRLPTGVHTDATAEQGFW